MRIDIWDLIYAVQMLYHWDLAADTFACPTLLWLNFPTSGSCSGVIGLGAVIFFMEMILLKITENCASNFLQLVCFDQDSRECQTQEILHRAGAAPDFCSQVWFLGTLPRILIPLGICILLKEVKGTLLSWQMDSNRKEGDLEFSFTLMWPGLWLSRQPCSRVWGLKHLTIFILRSWVLTLPENVMHQPFFPDRHLLIPTLLIDLNHFFLSLAFYVLWQVFM